MQLSPKGPPGRVTRKARAYHAEIHRLRDAGYTVSDIRQALHDVGVEVSLSTVWRESVRPSPASRSAEGSGVQTTASRPPGTREAASAADRPSGAPRTYVNDSRTGKQIVEEFMKGRTTNPLLQERT